MSQVPALFPSPEHSATGWQQKERFLCCVFMHNTLNEETWAGPGCWNQTCSTQRRPAAPPEPDAIKVLSVSGWDLFFATFGGVQSGPLVAQKLFCKAGARVTACTPRVGHAHTQTHRQAPAQSIPTPSWGQQWHQEAHLAYFGQPLQKLFSLPVTLGRAGKSQRGSRSRKRYSMFSSWEIAEAIFSQ